MADRVLNVGIDLGTSRTVIACDNGQRSFIPSYVGFPRDAVSRKMFGRDIIFGEEAIKHRMALNLYKPLEKGVIVHSDEPEKEAEGYKKSLYVARELLKQAIHLVAGVKSKETIIRGVIGAPALASKQNKKALLDVARGILDDVLIASEPFTVAYGLNLLSNALIIDIGAGTVDICRMHGTIPTDEDQITTLKAGDYIDKVFLDLVTKKYKEANLTINMIRKFKEENAFVSEGGERVCIVLPVDGKPTNLDVTDELRSACRSIVPEIVEAIRKIVASFDPEFQDGLKENVILAGGGSQIAGLKREIETHMEKTLGYGKVRKVEEPLYAGANGALLLCKDMPDEYWDELRNHSSVTKAAS
jgi:rod shape-determining protein MreB